MSLSAPCALWLSPESPVSDFVGCGQCGVRSAIVGDVGRRHLTGNCRWFGVVWVGAEHGELGERREEERGKRRRRGRREETEEEAAACASTEVGGFDGRVDEWRRRGFDGCGICGGVCGARPCGAWTCVCTQG